ncbi:type 1 fimbrial protein [Affinibrenneria salicis]|uniref:Type 1 fimbrial protein n=2 Tax=Affinibrenneria salicis TaxID=2590031 RepID=A0A5J5FWI5_9GAMM|nr:type 1 fimbrial protein [Affinibrenneria salicis]
MLVCGGALSLLSLDAAALECRKDTVTGPVSDLEDIGSLKIPSTLPLGSRLWTSKSYSRNLACWAYKSVKPNGEYAYFYPNPYGAMIGTGIGIGIIYNGQDLGVVAGGGNTNSRVSTGAWVAPGPSGSRPPANPTMVPATVQVYLEKIGEISNTSSGADSLDVFQVDGELGINNKPGGNYKLTLSGLHNIDVIQCSANVRVSPDSYIDFGTIPSWTSAAAGLLAQQNFRIDATTDGGEDCGQGFNLYINFDAMAKNNTLTGIDGMDMGNGSTLKIEDGSTGNNIPFNQFVGFVNNLTSASGTVEKNYTARLYASDVAVTGDVEKYIVLRFNYN